MDIPSIAHELNHHASNFRIAELQHIRKKLKNKSRLPASYIFGNQTIAENWAFHFGGRSELQFNIGIETIDDQKCLRFGVAFSFEPSQTLPDISILFPKVKRFNEFIRLYPEEFPGYFTWYWDEKRTEIFPEHSIRSDFVRQGVFAFFGKYVAWEAYSPEIVLQTFDQLLPLFEYVEGSESAEPLQVSRNSAFQFTANNFDGTDPTKYTQAEKIVNLNFRHVAIQLALFKRLRLIHGHDNVAAEFPSGAGNRVDIMVRSGDEYWFYEVKTGGTARSCIREALGQLLEYSLWPGAQNASKLIVVGEYPLDENAKTYLLSIRENFFIPIFYEQQMLEEF